MTATNRLFDQTGLTVTDGQDAEPENVNDLVSEINTAFEVVANELSDSFVGIELARSWANEDQGELIDATNYPTGYSSRANADEAADWASASGTVVTSAGVDTGEKSAKVLAEEASDDADAASVSAAAAAASAEQAIGSNTISAGTGIDITVTGSGPYDNEIIVDKSEIALDNVDNTSDVNKPVSTLTQAAIDALDNSDVGLGNVDNTSDANKPVSTDQQTEIDSKVLDLAYSYANWNGVEDRAPSADKLRDKFSSVDANVNNVDNTSDADKPISDDTQDALDLIPKQNMIINGGFQIWQRSSGSSATGYSSADRWYMDSNQNVTQNVQSDGENNEAFLTATSGTGTNQGMYQGVELNTWSSGVDQLKGRTFTLSYEIYNASSWHGFTRVQYVDEVASPTNAVIVSSLDNTHSNTGGAWSTITKTFTISADRAVTSKALEIYIGIYKFGDVGSGVETRIRNVKLEEASEATPFVLPLIGDELARCQRYCLKVDKIDVNGSGAALNSRVSQSFMFPVKMRATPAITNTPVWAYTLNAGTGTVAIISADSARARVFNTLSGAAYEVAASVSGILFDAEL